MKKFFKQIANTILIAATTVSTFSMVNVAHASRVRAVTGADLKPMTNMINRYSAIAAVFITVMALGAFVFNVIRLGTSSGNMGKREEAIRGLMLSGAVAMLVPFTGTIYYFLISL